MASSSTSAQSGTGNNPDTQQRLCKCDPPEPALWKASNSDQNPERRYWYCRRRGRRDECKFWLWIDPELTTHYKDSFLKLKAEKDLAVEQLIRERKMKKRDEEVEEQEFPEHDVAEELKQLAKILRTLECKMKWLYVVFVVIGVLIMFLKV